MGQFDDIIKRGFLTEAAELLDKAENGFLDFERDPQDRKIIAELFRLIHTVKSSAFAAGFENLGKFIHLLETLLAMVRDGQIEASQQIVDLMLKSNDRLRQIINQLSGNYDEPVDLSDIDQHLQETINVADKSNVDLTEPSGTKSVFSHLISPFLPHGDEKNISVLGNVGPKFDLPMPPPGVNLSSALNPTVLLCDDEPEILLIAAEMLKFRFPVLNIISAADGHDALTKIVAHRPHVIITDMKMPHMNGIEFIREVRKFDANVPVIFFSAYADREHMIEFIKLGVMDFQDKPIDPDRLGLSVATALKLAQNREGIARLSSLNFRAYMSTLRLSQLTAEEKNEADEISSKVKVILDEVAVLSNFMLGL